MPFIQKVPQKNYQASISLHMVGSALSISPMKERQTVDCKISGSFICLTGPQEIVLSVDLISPKLGRFSVALANLLSPLDFLLYFLYTYSHRDSKKLEPN